MQTNNMKLYNWLMDDDKREEILELGLKLAKESFDNTLQGWDYRIVLDIDGGIDYQYTNNGSLMSEHEGIGLCVLKVSGYVDIDDSYLDCVENSIDDDEYNNFIEWIKTQYGSDDECYVNWNEYQEFNEENYFKLLREAWELTVDNCYYDRLSDKLWNTIGDLSRQLDIERQNIKLQREEIREKLTCEETDLIDGIMEKAEKDFDKYDSEETTVKVNDKDRFIALCDKLTYTDLQILDIPNYDTVDGELLVTVTR